jgi:mitogen-activated protein kinase-activated protein kinase 2
MYILCCGYPPFYSTHGRPISPGMKKNIKTGNYDFPGKEWSNVSIAGMFYQFSFKNSKLFFSYNIAKMLISGMLEIKPTKRLNIDDIINSQWISVIYFILN